MIEKLKSNRVLVVIPNSTLGGAEQVLFMIVKKLLKEKYFVDVFFLKNTKENAWDELKSDKLSMFYMDYKTETRGAFKFLLKMIFKKRKKYTISFTSHISCTAMVGLLSLLSFLKIENIIARESTPIFKRYSGIKKALYIAQYKIGYKKIKLLICQTHLMKEQLIENLPYLEKKIDIIVIPNPVDLENIYLNSSEDLKLFKEEHSQDYKVIVAAGRLIQEKGFDVLIESFYELYTSHSKKIKLIILGEGPGRNFLQNKINDLGLKEHIILKGFVNNIFPYFKQANLCVVSSRIEGFPNVLLQMMSQNVNVVSTLCAGDIQEIPGIQIAEETTSPYLSKAILKSLNTDSKENRAIFDTYLQKRDINQFMKNVLLNIDYE